MPSAEAWSLYPALGVLVLLLGVIGLGARAMWREYRIERQEQRVWEEEQDEKRDTRWQSFITAMKIEQARENEADRKSISNLANVIEGMRQAVEHLTTTLKNHIIEDDARFEVLLKPEQKSAVEDVKTQPRKRG